MKKYLKMLNSILHFGERRTDRTGIGTLGLFGYDLTFNLQDGFPLVTTKKMFFHGIKAEILWFLRGDTDIKWLQDQNVHIWDEFADDEGYVGPMYGYQWRHWNGYYDQISTVINQIQTDPTSRYHVVTAWNPSDLKSQALGACHMMFQFYVRGGRYLDCRMMQRSCDAFLGVPFNIAGYALLTHMVAQVCGLEPGQLQMSFNDVHIYTNHVDQVEEQLKREPLAKSILMLKKGISDIDEFEMEDIGIVNYKHYEAIKAPLAVGPLRDKKIKTDTEHN